MSQVLLIATRRDPGDPIGEAEPVLFVLDPRGTRLLLDDGTELTFDPVELRSAIQPARAVA